MRKRSKTLTILGLAVILVLLLTACQAGSVGPQISIENAWGRPSPKVATAGAFYMVIKNTGSGNNSGNFQDDGASNHMPLSGDNANIGW